MFQSGQLVRVNLAGLQAEGVMFQAAVTDAVGHIVKQTSEQPPIYLVKLFASTRTSDPRAWLQHDGNSEATAGGKPKRKAGGSASR